MERISKDHLGLTLGRRSLIAVLGMALAMVGVMGASADDNDIQITYRYLVGSGFTELGQVCNLGIPCPTAAMASNGDTIEIGGEGKLSIRQKDGKPRSVTGGGSFLHKDADGNVLSVGTWTAKRLLSFAPFGPGVGTPPTWEAGRAEIRVRLVDDVGGTKAAAILEVGCHLPGNPGAPGTIEGVRLNILGGLDFNQAIEPRATLFINLRAEEDEDD
jgi:hypothetical protein